MPLPRCYHCAHEEELDPRTYGYYKGPVTCQRCKKRYYVECWQPAKVGQSETREIRGLIEV